MKTKIPFLIALLAVSSTFAIGQHSHDHGEMHFSHPLIVESPSPDTKVRLDYFFSRRNDAGEIISGHTPRLEFEYAFRRSFSIEVNAPYTFNQPESAPGQSHLDTVEVSFKFASFAFDEKHILPTYGLSFNLPTGNDSGIGSNHIVEIEPFAGLGYKHKKIQLVGIVSVGLATNKRAGDEEGTEFGFGLASMYKVTPRFEALLEFDGHRPLTGGEERRTVANISPGLKFLPFNDHWQIGVSAGFPVTHTKDFNIRTVVSVFYHF
jgi:hypothetical protein